MIKQIKFDIEDRPAQQGRKIFKKAGAIPREVCDLVRNYALSDISGFARSPNIYDKTHFDVRCHTCQLPLDYEPLNSLVQVLEPIWQEAFDFYQYDLSFINLYEVKRYSVGDYATEHNDLHYGSYRTIERKLSMIALLNDDSEYTGGDTIITRRTESRDIGSLYIFPATYPHEIKPVISGERWSLNCWAWGPDWK